MLFIKTLQTLRYKAIRLGSKPEERILSLSVFTIMILTLILLTLPYFVMVKASQNLIVQNVTVGQGPIDTHYDPTKEMINVTNFGSANVSIIDGRPGSVTENKVISTQQGATFPNTVAFNSANNKTYVTNFTHNTVSVIVNANTTKQVNVGVFPLGIAFDSANDNLYVANSNSSSISIIDGKPGSSSEDTVIKTISVGSNSTPYGVAFDSAPPPFLLLISTADILAL